MVSGASPLGAAPRRSLNPVNTSWQVAGTGNFVGNGEDGILWRNPSTGGVELWNPNGSGGFNYEALAPVNTNWQIAGTGDFTGNGEDGILWHNSSTGDVELRNPNGSGGFNYEALAWSTPTGRSSGRMISPGTASPGFSGATAPTATRSYGIPTARAASLTTIWASSRPTGRCKRPSLEMKAKQRRPSRLGSLRPQGEPRVGRLVRPRYSHSIRARHIALDSARAARARIHPSAIKAMIGSHHRVLGIIPRTARSCPSTLRARSKRPALAP